jgi:DNA-binding IclR family transcriptional regulator
MTAFDTEPQASQWDGVRNAFFCATSGEIEPDTAAVAAPVFGIGDRFEGALAVTGPAFRFSAEKVAAMRRPLLEAALGLTRDFGGGVGRLEMALAKLKVDQG